ncbi:SRPBCC domain-containing protein [Paenibacillus sp. GCM10027627]|uniref:SRPBCC family protein n=1 Tax=unclassified Paenibacillus TaxID=185978 RepID=UPI003640CE1C
MFLKKKKTAPATGKRGLYMTRIYDVSPEQLFQWFTQGEHMKHWWGPRGYEMTILSQTLEPGGFIHYKQLSPDGLLTYGKFSYKEIESPGKLVYTSSFADETGRPIRAYFSKDWPLEILNTVTFDEYEGKTKLTLHGTAHDAKKAEVRIFEAMSDHLKKGFTETFDLLNEYIQKHQ